jgi:transcriptional regulator with XRE-family HTH domain
LSQAEFATRFGLSRNQLANIETGRVVLNLEMGYRMAKALDISPGWFVGRSEEPFPQLEPNMAKWLEDHCASKVESAFVEGWPVIQSIIELDQREDQESREWLDRFYEHFSTFDVNAALGLPPEKHSVKIHLTNPATSGKLGGVKKNQWPELKQKIQQAASEPGVKSALAKFLGVHLTQLSKWLTDSKIAREPGAEYALQMKYWVENIQSAKQK